MNNPKFIFSAAKILFVSLFYAAVSFAQTETAQTPKSEPSYDVILQTIVASNNTLEKSALSPTLAGVIKKLKLNYPYNFNLSSTYIQRVANTGNVDFKSFLSNLEKENSTTVYLEWDIGQLSSLSDIQGKNSIQIKNFRFRQRVPVGNLTGKESEGTSNAPTFYEAVGLTIQKLTLSENTPTVIGSLTTSKPDGITFLILTVRPSEN